MPIELNKALSKHKAVYGLVLCSCGTSFYQQYTWPLPLCNLPVHRLWLCVDGLTSSPAHILFFYVLFFYWLVGWLVEWMIDLLIGWLVGWLIDWWLVGWLIDWLVSWLNDWLIDWLIDWLEGGQQPKYILKLRLFTQNNTFLQLLFILCEEIQWKSIHPLFYKSSD